MLARKHRVLVVSQGIPHPERGASTVLFYSYIDALRENGYSVLNILLLQNDDYSDENLSQYEELICRDGNVEIFPCKSERLITSSRFRHRLVVSPPISMVKAVEKFCPDTVFCLDLMSAWFSLKLSFSCPQVVWLGDLNFQSYWYNSLYGRREGTIPFWQLVWAVAQRYAWRKIYRRVLVNFEKVIVSSKSSEPALADIGIDSTYLPYPWPSPFDKKQMKFECPEIPTFVFFGTLQALGSRSAFHFLIDKVYPLAVNKFGKNKFSIKISGQGTLPEWAAVKLIDMTEVEFVGFVDDLGEFFSQAHAMIAPIDVPVGNRSRIVTAMAAGLPIIAHENTVLGNPDLIDKENCLLARTPEEFVTGMHTIFKHPDIREVISGQALRVYQEKFSPKRATEALMNEIFFTNKSTSGNIPSIKGEV